MFVSPRFVRFGSRLALFVSVAVAPSTHSARRIVAIRRSSVVVGIANHQMGAFTPPNSLSYQKTP
jgi:hypothetical protein